MSHDRLDKVLRWVAALWVLATVLLLASAELRAQTKRSAEFAIPPVRSEMVVSTDWLAKHLQDPGIIVLHVARERSHYDAGHIPGARFLALNEIVTTVNGVPNELPAAADLEKVFANLGAGDDTRIVLYGEESGLFAARAYFTLDYLGHGERAALLDGGLEKWRAEKRPISTEAPQPKAGRFTAHIQPKVLVQLPMIRDLAHEAATSPSPSVVLIDARPAEDYSGQRSSEGVARPGHIPGAVNVFWMQHLESNQDPSLRPPFDLRKLYQAAGAGPGKKVVTYCRTGIQASHTYFVAKFLGYDVAMYDGSFLEWNRNPDLPVEKSK